MVDLKPSDASTRKRRAKPRADRVLPPGMTMLQYLRREVVDLILQIRAAEVGPRIHTRLLGWRPFLLWLPNIRDEHYRRRIADQCRRLNDLTADEEAMASAFEREAAQTPGWR